MADKLSLQTLFDEMEKLKKQFGKFEKAIEQSVETKVIPMVNKALKNVETTLRHKEKNFIDPNYRQRLIERCAYQKWLNRGQQDGYEIQDWLAAEEEIDARLGQKTKQ